jgi:hypothetical protein
LAHEVNFPLNNVLFMSSVVGVQGALNYLLGLNFSKLIAELALSMSSSLQLSFLLVVVPIMAYVYYQIYQLCSQAILHLFPNGIGFSNKNYPTCTMQQKLDTAPKIKQLIEELKNLHASQSNAKWCQRLLCAIISLLPYSTSLTVKDGALYLPETNLALRFTALGAAVSFLPEQEDTFASTLLQFFSLNYQAVTINSWIAKQWGNFRQEKQLNKQLDYLRQLSQCQNWKLKNIKKAPIFELDLK